jgi:hypothetical protein
MRLTTRLLLVLASCFALGAVAVPSHAALLGAKKALKNAASVKFTVKASVTDGVSLRGTATKSVTLRR